MRYPKLRRARTGAARYLNEFDFRYSHRAALDIDEAVRATRILRGAEGKRLMYHQASGQEGA